MIDINVLINDIKKNDVSSFAGKYSENKYIDFKEYSPLFVNPGKSKHEDVKNELVSDITSFANTSGGCVIYGIKEINRVPVEFKPFEESSIENLETSLGQIIRARSEPSLHTYRIHSVNIETNKYIIIISVNRSFNAPHALKDPSKDYYRFYGRTDEGSKYPYRYNQLKNSFIQRETLNDKIKIFRDHRLNLINAGDTPIPLESDSKIIMHLTPLSAFDSNEIFDIDNFYHEYGELIPMHNRFTGLNRRRNLDGILTYDTPSNSGKHYGYVQLYRTGIIEAVDSYTLSNIIPDHGKYIPGQFYEERLITSLARFLHALKTLNIVLPIYCSITLTGVKGYRMTTDLARNGSKFSDESIDREVLMLPEFEIDNLSCSITESASMLKQTFDLIWNSCGIAKSDNYNKSGECIIKFNDQDVVNL